MSQIPAPRPWRWLGCAVTLVTLWGCAGAVGVAADAGPATSAPTGADAQTPSSAGPQGDANQGNDAAVTGPSYAGALALSPNNAPTLCLSANATTPAEGVDLVLRSCTGAVNQRFTSVGGRLRTEDGTLCVTDPQALQPSPLFGVPQLAACDDANFSTVQHVVPSEGLLLNRRVPDPVALASGTAPTEATVLLWLAYTGNPNYLQWSLTAAADFADGAGQDDAVRGFQLVAAADVNRCLDVNYVAPGELGTSVGTTPCDAALASQRWTYVHGQLRTARGCLDATDGALGLATCQEDAVAQVWQVSSGALQPAAYANLCVNVAASDAGQATLVNCALAGGWTWGQTAAP